MTQEFWKDIDGYKGLYQVSNYGNVKSLDRKITYSNGIIVNYKEKELTPDLVRGYCRFTLSKNNTQKRFLSHRLVGFYFLNNTFNKPCINHIDGNKLNNYHKNLEWCTYSENERHSYDVLKKINNRRKLTQDSVKDIRDNCKKGIYGNVISFAKKYNVSKEVILNVLKRLHYV